MSAARTASSPAELLPARALAPSSSAPCTRRPREKAAPATRRWLALGDGATRFRDDLRDLAVEVPADSVAAAPRERRRRSAASGRARRPQPDTSQILPDYRRRPDAELALEAAVAGGASRG